MWHLCLNSLIVIFCDVIFFLPDFELSYLFPIGCLGDIINLCNCFDVPRQSRVSEVGIAGKHNPGDTGVKKGCLWSQKTAGGLGSFDTCGEVGSGEGPWPSKAFCGSMREVKMVSGLREWLDIPRAGSEWGTWTWQPEFQDPGGGTGFPTCSLPGHIRIQFAYPVKRSISIFS